MKICRARPQLVFTLDNRFSSAGCAAQQSVRYIIFRLQASHLSATSRTGRKSYRVKSLYMKFIWSWVISVYLCAEQRSCVQVLTLQAFHCTNQLVHVYTIHWPQRYIYSCSLGGWGGGGVRTLELKGSMCQIMGTESQACLLLRSGKGPIERLSEFSARN